MRLHRPLADAEPGAPIDLAAYLQDVAETVVATVPLPDQMDLWVEQIACEDDAGALMKAEHLLASTQYRTAELWQGARLVGKWGNSENPLVGASKQVDGAPAMPSGTSDLIKAGR